MYPKNADCCLAKGVGPPALEPPCDSFRPRALYVGMASPPGEDLAATLVDRHGRSIRQYILRATRRVSVAEDLVQEVFLRIVRAAPGYDPRERERAWVFRIARNVLIDSQRREARSREDHRPVDVASGPAQALSAALDAALAALAPEDRECFLLAEVGGLTYAEIERVTGSSVAAIRSRVYRARMALRASLSPPPRLSQQAIPMRDDDD
jgi:RNA polymerase sigma-70 factor, ECF subfamily